MGKIHAPHNPIHDCGFPLAVSTNVFNHICACIWECNGDGTPINSLVRDVSSLLEEQYNDGLPVFPEAFAWAATLNVYQSYIFLQWVHDYCRDDSIALWGAWLHGADMYDEELKYIAKYGHCYYKISRGD